MTHPMRFGKGFYQFSHTKVTDILKQKKHVYYNITTDISNKALFHMALSYISIQIKMILHIENLMCYNTQLV